MPHVKLSMESDIHNNCVFLYTLGHTYITQRRRYIFKDSVSVYHEQQTLLLMMCSPVSSYLCVTALNTRHRRRTGQTLRAKEPPSRMEPQQLSPEPPPLL